MFLLCYCYFLPYPILIRRGQKYIYVYCTILYYFLFYLFKFGHHVDTSYLSPCSTCETRILRLINNIICKIILESLPKKHDYCYSHILKYEMIHCANHHIKYSKMMFGKAKVISIKELINKHIMGEHKNRLAGTSTAQIKAENNF